MAHEIERRNGRESFAFTGRKVPWHGLGQSVSDSVTAGEMLKAANLDWEVKLSPAFNREHGEVGRSLISDTQFVERWQLTEQKPLTPWTDVPAKKFEYVDTLGVVGKSFKAVQNSQLAEVLSKVSATPTSDIKWSSAGSLRGGRDVFFVADLPDDGFNIPGDSEDSIDSYLVAHDSKVGAHSLRVFQTSVRPVCMNTLVASFGQATKAVAIRHSGDISQKIKALQGALTRESQQWARYREWLGNLSEVEIDMDNFVELVDDYFGRQDLVTGKGSKLTMSLGPKDPFYTWSDDGIKLSEGDEVPTLNRKQRNLVDIKDGVYKNYARERGNTLYHALQAGTEYLQHGSLERPKNIRSLDTNFASVLTGDTNKQMWGFGKVVDDYAVAAGRASFNELTGKPHLMAEITAHYPDGKTETDSVRIL